ncbi:DUF2076 domain-containing protein [Methylobacter tundripaludum]|uniref:DUF2076 domain-containing protein n=1 Tax=Methylobacter tundripaludum TaxID=173365 RepID=UPI0004DFC3B3|nr:DUF2076 domain-containing protein [Methylobacter tundripaludum]
MNSQERDQLNQLLKQLGEVKLTTKDAEAEAMIREAAALQPDATYLLVQRALLLEQAVTGAKARIDELQHQLQCSQSEQKNGFLSNDPWAQPAATAGQAPGAASYQTPRYAPQPQQVAASGFGSGGSSFLGNVATTATGVVAGSFLFQGIENLMGHHSSGFGQQPSGEQFTEQTIINNNYGNDAGQQAANNDDRNDYLASNDDDNFQDDSFQDDFSDSDWS